MGIRAEKWLARSRNSINKDINRNEQQFAKILENES
jgi:hypothetical protein